MASTRKSQLVLTCNAQAIKDVFEYLNKELERIKVRRDQLLKQYEGRMWTADAKREFKQLGDDIAAITSMQQKNEEEMRKYGEVMQDLAGSKLKDVKAAMREVSSALNKMTEKDPNRQKLIDDLAKLRNEIEIIGGKRRSLTDVTNDLKDLANVRLDHLKQDLDVVRAKYASLTGAQQQGSAGQSLRNTERKLAAQIAVNETGPTPTTSVKNMTAEQMQAERQRLSSAYSTVSQSIDPAHIQMAQQYLDRIHELNTAIEEAKNKRVDIGQVLSDPNASLEKLEAALKQAREDAGKIAISDENGIKQAADNIEQLEQKIAGVKAQLDGHQ